VQNAEISKRYSNITRNYNCDEKLNKFSAIFDNVTVIFFQDLYKNYILLKIL
jgi:hypothetical protein